MAGSSAAVLIGLIFVVVTLMQDCSRSSMLAGSRLYIGPVVLQVSFVLVLSAGALAGADAPHWTDACFYGAIPAALYLALGAVAVGFWSGSEWAVGGIAVVVTSMLLNAIRNEWDLVTWLAPHADEGDPFDGA